jgi:hypothetical protein
MDKDNNYLTYQFIIYWKKVRISEEDVVFFAYIHRCLFSLFLSFLSFFLQAACQHCPLPFFFLLSFLPLLADTSHTLHSIFFSFLFPRHFFLYIFFFFFVSFSHVEVLCIAEIVYWVSPQVRGERKLHSKKIYTQD